MRTNPGNKMTKRTMFLTCQLVNGMNDFRFSQVDFIKLPPIVLKLQEKPDIPSFSLQQVTAVIGDQVMKVIT